MIFGKYGRHSIRFKFIIFSVAIQILMISFLVWNSIRLSQYYLTQQTEVRMIDLVPLLNTNFAAPLIQEDIATLKDILDQIVDENRINYIAIKNIEGSIIADKGKRSSTEHQHFDFVSRLFNVSDHYIYHKEFPIQIDGHVAGELFFELNTTFSDLAIHDIRNQSVLIAIVAILSTLVILTFLTFKLSRNLIKLSNLLRKYPSEQIEINIPSNNKDEVGTLFIVFSNMIKKLANRDQEIQQHHDELEQTVKKRTSELETSNKELESFSYSISHDLRAPLRSISSFSSIIAEDYENVLDDTGKDYLKRIVENTRHMTKLIDSLLLLSRTIKTPLKLKIVDLSDAVEKSFSQLQESNPDRHAILNYEKNITITADPTLIRTVIDNLIGNAWKYSEEKSESIIHFGTLQEKDKTIYFIKDNGIGFNMKYASKIFTPFQRIHKNDDFSGLGIGLATVHRIISRHNGKIWYESKENEGASFFFTLE